MKRREFIKTAVTGIGSIAIAGCMDNSMGYSTEEEIKAEYRDYTDEELITSVVEKYSEILSRFQSIAGTTTKLTDLMRSRNYTTLNEDLSQLETAAAEASVRHTTISAQISLFEERHDDTFDAINTVVNSVRVSVQAARQYLRHMRDAAEAVPSDNVEKFDDARVEASRDYSVFADQFETLPSTDSFTVLLESAILN